MAGFFPHDFWTARYWPGTYWPPGVDEIVPIEPAIGGSLTVGGGKRKAKRQRDRGREPVRVGRPPDEFLRRPTLDGLRKPEPEPVPEPPALPVPALVRAIHDPQRQPAFVAPPLVDEHDDLLDDIELLLVAGVV